MKNLFILGNGFDLAHGYRTDYRSFIEFLLGKNILVKQVSFMKDGRLSYPPHRTYNSGSSAVNCEYISEDKNKLPYDKYNFYVKNELLKTIYKQINANGWCDIETLYYKLLNSNRKPKDVNLELEELKKHLGKYLEEFESNNSIKEFDLLFNILGVGAKNLVVNFNYTSVFKQFYETQCQCEVVNIHGQLNSKLNPIIFGYAPTIEETQNLIEKNDNEYLKNIKRYYYKQTDSENKLKNFLGNKKLKGEEFNVFIIGHSCGISDRKILNDIFTHPNIQNINIVYYKDYNGYFDTLVNIDRIIGGESDYGVVRNIELSLACPQHDDINDTKALFMKKLNSLKLDIENSKDTPQKIWKA